MWARVRATCITSVTLPRSTLTISEMTSWRRDGGNTGSSRSKGGSGSGIGGHLRISSQTRSFHHGWSIADGRRGEPLVVQQQAVVVRRDPRRAAVRHEVAERLRRRDVAVVDVQPVLADRRLRRVGRVVRLVRRVRRVGVRGAAGGRVLEPARVAGLVGERTRLVDRADRDAAAAASADRAHRRRRPAGGRSRSSPGWLPSAVRALRDPAVQRVPLRAAARRRERRVLQVVGLHERAGGPERAPSTRPGTG